MRYVEVQFNDRLASDEAVQKSAFKCAEYDVLNISCLPIFIPVVKSVANILNISALIDYPYGVSTHEPKIADILRVARMGVRTVDLVLNHTYIAQNKWNSLYNDIYNCQRVCFDKKIELRCILEHSLFDIEKVISTCHTLEQCVVHTLILGTGTLNIDETDSIVVAKTIEKDYGLSVVCTTNIFKAAQVEPFKKANIFGLRFVSPIQYRNCFGV